MGESEYSISHILLFVKGAGHNILCFLQNFSKKKSAKFLCKANIAKRRLMNK